MQGEDSLKDKNKTVHLTMQGIIFLCRGLLFSALFQNKLQCPATIFPKVLLLANSRLRSRESSYRHPER